MPSHLYGQPFIFCECGLAVVLIKSTPRLFVCRCENVGCSHFGVIYKVSNQPLELVEEIA